MNSLQLTTIWLIKVGNRSVRTLLWITRLAPRKSYLINICPNSHANVTKTEIKSSWSRFEHFSELLVWPLESHMWSLFAPINMKTKLSSHYLFQFWFIWSYLSRIYHFGPYLVLVIYIYVPLFIFSYIHLPLLSLLPLYLVIFTLNWCYHMSHMYPTYVFVCWDCTSVQSVRASRYFFMDILHLNYVRLIWTFQVIKGQRSWSKVRGHIWLTICDFNKAFSNNI